MIGWLGVAVTGSDVSSNSLFGALQVTAAKQSGLSPILMAAANTFSGVLGTDLAPEPGDRRRGGGPRRPGGRGLRPVVDWSLVLPLAMRVIVYLQSTDVLGWMVVD